VFLFVFVCACVWGIACMYTYIYMCMSVCTGIQLAQGFRHQKTCKRVRGYTRSYSKYTRDAQEPTPSSGFRV
jgi:hypothetical protein